MKTAHTANGTFPGTPLVGDDSFAKLYHYTNLDSFIKIWENQTLKFGVISGVNDINEYSKRISTSLYNGTLIEIGQRIRIAAEIINSYKQISFTKDYDSYIKGCMSPMMWGHYGAKGKGVCIELDYNKIHFDDKMYRKSIIYSNLIKNTIEVPILVNDKSTIEEYIIKELDNIFFTKTSDWIGENEFRVVSNKHDFLDISNAITNVYVTDYCSDTCIKVEKLVNDQVPVSFLHYIGTGSGWRLPVLTDIKRAREQELKSRNNPNNVLNLI